MKKKTRKILWIAGVAALSLLFAACGTKGENGKNTVQLPVETTEQEETRMELPTVDELPTIEAGEASWYNRLTDAGAYRKDYNFGSTCLFGDTSVNVETIFAELFDSHTWDSSCMENWENRGFICDAVCQLGESQVRLRFYQIFDETHISKGMIDYADGRVQTLDEEDVSRLMKWMCQEYHERTNTAPWSPVRDLIGTWRIQDETGQLVIEKDRIAENEYEIILVDGGNLAITIFPEEEPARSCWFVMEEEEAVLYQAEGREMMGSPLSMGDYMGKITRIPEP